MKSTIKFLLIALIMFSFTAVKAQKEVGIWKTIDDKTNKPRSHVELYIKNGKLYGKVVKLLNIDETNPLCTECTGSLHNKPVLGMQVVNGLTKRKSDWFMKLGILDPDTGKIYDCKMWLEDANTLNIRGFQGPFYRTQTWYRVE